MIDDKVLENRLRRTLDRRGYRLEKSRRRDPRAVTFGRYWVFENYNNTVVQSIPTSEHNCDATVTLDEIAAWCDSSGKAAKATKPAPVGKRRKGKGR